MNKVPHLLPTVLPLFAFEGPKMSTLAWVKQGSKVVLRNVVKFAMICSILAALCYLFFRYGRTAFRNKEIPFEFQRSLSFEPECDFDMSWLVFDGMM